MQIESTFSGLVYNYFRDYDPSVGRYIESDPIGLKGGINSFAYVESNPIKRIDADGKFWTEILVPAVVIYTGLSMYQSCVKTCTDNKKLEKRDENCPTEGQDIGYCAEKCKGFIDLVTTPLSPKDAGLEAGKMAGQSAQ